MVEFKTVFVYCIAIKLAGVYIYQDNKPLSNKRQGICEGVECAHKVLIYYTTLACEH